MECKSGSFSEGMTTQPRYGSENSNQRKENHGQERCPCRKDKPVFVGLRSSERYKIRRLERQTMIKLPQQQHIGVESSMRSGVNCSKQKTAKEGVQQQEDMKR